VVNYLAAGIVIVFKMYDTHYDHIHLTGVSYDAFLKSQRVSVNKTFFPYEWFDDLQKLDQRTFPDYVSFYSSIKRRNTLEPDSLSDLTSDELTLLGRPQDGFSQAMTEMEKFQIGFNRHQELSGMFYQNQWSFKDFLIYYNNRYYMNKWS